MWPRRTSKLSQVSPATSCAPRERETEKGWTDITKAGRNAGQPAPLAAAAVCQRWLSAIIELVLGRTNRRCEHVFEHVWPLLGYVTSATASQSALARNFPA